MRKMKMRTKRTRKARISTRRGRTKNENDTENKDWA